MLIVSQGKLEKKRIMKVRADVSQEFATLGPRVASPLYINTRSVNRYLQPPETVVNPSCEEPQRRYTANMSNIRVELSREEDIPRLMEIVIPAFEADEYPQIVGDTNTPQNLLAAGRRHLNAWREHAQNFSQPFWIKCIHTDPSSGKESIIASAEWLIYDRARTEQEYTNPIYVLTADWVSDPTERQRARELLQPMLDKRIEWFAGMPHAILMYMATDPAFRRQGAASACVQWGLDRCAELDIPAYLEASDAGAPVYGTMGFQTCERVQTGLMTCAVMIRWPENFDIAQRKPVLTATEVRVLRAGAEKT